MIDIAAIYIEDLKVQGKFTLKEAMNVHRGSRCIAILFL
jgi:hypothetical protein